MAQKLSHPNQKCLTYSGDAKISVGKMAITELMQMMASLMDDKLKNIPTKEDFDEIKANVKELCSKLNKLKSENETLKNEIHQLREEKDYNRQQILYLQQHVKRNNIVFKGIEAKNSLEEAVKECCSKNLKLPSEVNVLSTKKLFESNNKIGVIAEFSSRESVNEVLRNTKMLAGSNIFIERDLTSEQLKNKRVMLQLKKNIQEVSRAYNILVRNEKIKIGDKWLYWNKDKELTSGKENGNLVLENLYGQQITCINVDYYGILNKLNNN